MRDLRVSFRVATSTGTPFQADTLFGHLCWAIVYLEGEDALKEFLDACTEKPPLLISDGFPALADSDGRLNTFYLPRPELPFRSGDAEKLEQMAGIQTGKAERKKLYTAFKMIDKLKMIEESSLAGLCQEFNSTSLAEAFLKLKLCPISCRTAEQTGCKCTDWRECPGLAADDRKECACQPVKPSVISMPVSHNAINRWSLQSDEFFVQTEEFPGEGFHFLVRINEDFVTRKRLEGWLDYLCHSGYGRDSTTGKGALTDLQTGEFSWPVRNAGGFLNLSSAYVPKAGELGEGSYSFHVKRGKLGAEYVLKHSPWKKPILMIRAGSVFRGDPDTFYGCLVRNVHYELPEVVQYGYAFPLGVNADV